ncbi:MAG TPA: alpha/beta fold hydrolase [Steroidobacteraceae bacterium]|jgi:homoserine O-acetyltransferase
MNDVSPAQIVPHGLKPVESDHELTDFQFETGERLPTLRIHYRTLGQARRDAQGVVRNAVLVLHSTSGNGAQFLGPDFAGELFGPGQPLDAGKFFIVLPDGIGHGRSSRPSDGLRARFPRYGYRDMVAAQHRLLTAGLGIDHLRLVMGTSMGGMHTWLWGEEYPDFMDALLPLGALPTQISGRNRVWRRIIIDAIRNDPDWRGGDYRIQPPSLRTALQIMYLMSSNAPLRYQQMPTLKDTDAGFDAAIDAALPLHDTTDYLYLIEASRDYDPGPRLEQIRAPLLAVNFNDDLINPPELGILERDIRRVPGGRMILTPSTVDSRGHDTMMAASVWKQHLVQLLDITTTR